MLSAHVADGPILVSGKMRLNIGLIVTLYGRGSLFLTDEENSSLTLYDHGNTVLSSVQKTS